MTSAHAQEPFDHHSPRFAERWPEIYAGMRTRCPVGQSPQHGGFYAVTRYDDVRRVLQEPETFASGRELEFDGRIVGGATVPVTASRLGMMEMDPPASLIYRRLIAPYFSARTVREYVPRLTTIVDWILDRTIESGRMDVVGDLGAMLPPLVIVDLLGLPLERWQHYAHALHQGAGHVKGSARAIVGVMREMRELVAEWRARGAGPPGVCTALLEAEVDGRPIDDDLVAELVFMLLTGGVDTTTAQISNVVEHLDAHPGLRLRLIEDPDAVPSATDELLRLYSPGTGAARTVVAPTTLGDVALRPGDRLFLGIGSANRDETVFPDAETVDPDRSNAHKHVAFGLGVHRCVGAYLARAELVEVVRAVLRRMPDFAIDREALVHRPIIPLVNGWTVMPIRFTPGPRVVPEHLAPLPCRTAVQPDRPRDLAPPDRSSARHA
ncbi:cytochrome P450 [Streptomyces brasiliensis]|uniref:Cytochrome P450 n=1 Tax=Streptomyces brasiliensis TaxID=1954 RepID=A0A917L249_9ACTN|nr:cytochrome P450 [Streptomyces brasiliensis]GGJ40911.1 cytochrome P450 [Streptomyces brasiliensis]